MSNPLSNSEPWSLVSEGYATDTMPLFRQFCEHAIELSGPSADDLILDLACGPGTLSLLLYDRVKEIHAVDFSEGMLEQFHKIISEQKIQNIKTYNRDGQNLSFENEMFHHAFSIFGLMFFPDRIRGMKEVHRTLKIGGSAVITSWAPIKESPLLELMFSAMTEAVPASPAGNNEKILNLDDRDLFYKEMAEAGFKNIEITFFDGGQEIINHKDFLDSMIRGSAPIVMMKKNLMADAWKKIYDTMLVFIKKELPNLPQTLTSRAYYGFGKKT